MIREHIFSSRTPTDPHFRWRGGDISRLEGLSDAAFAFAMTLLLVDSFQDLRGSGALIEQMLHTVSLVACFAILIWIWATHYKFFRRFGLEDNYMIVLNSALLFTVMIYVYPLKFLFDFVINVLLFRMVPTDDAGREFNPLRLEDAVPLMQIYGAGYILIFGLFALMVRHAWNRREVLQLDAIERHLTRASLRTHLLTCAVGLFSIGLTSLVFTGMNPGLVSMIAGLSYTLNGPVQYIHGTKSGKRLLELEQQLAPAAHRDD